MKKIIAVVLTLMLVLPALPLGVSAVTDYNLSVGDEYVMSNRLSGEGWSFDPSSNTLTLENFSYSGSGHTVSKSNLTTNYAHGAIAYDSIETLTVKVVGNNSVTAYGVIGNLAAGIYTRGPLVITGGGSLTCEATGGSDCIGIASEGKLTVKDVRLTAKSGYASNRSYGLRALTVVIDGAEVNAESGTSGSSNSCGIYAGKIEGVPAGSTGIEINGSAVRAIGKEYYFSSSKCFGAGIASDREIYIYGSSVYAENKSTSGYGFYFTSVDSPSLFILYPSFVTAVGEKQAIHDKFNVLNGEAGVGWTDTAGTSGKTALKADLGSAPSNIKKICIPEPVEYDLWIEEKQVTSEELWGDGWRYRPNTNTLTLNDFTYSGAGHVCTEGASHAAAVYYGGNSAFNVVAEGKNVVTHNELNAATSCALYSETQLNISGHGTLELYCGFGTAYAVALLVNGSLNVEDVTLKAVATGAGDNRGINVSNKAAFKNCSVDVSSGDCDPDYRSFGIGSDENFTVYIEDTVKSFVASGMSAAIGATYDGRYATVVNSVAGMGWDDPEGTGDGKAIPVNADGATYDYKKVVFPWIAVPPTLDLPQDDDLNYLIASEADWNALADFVAQGGNTADKRFLQTKSISAGTMVGTSNYPFKGAYDGGGNTLDFNIESKQERIAPFPYVRDAAISRLHVTGSISVSGRRASGLIGENYGSSTVTDCRVSAEISGSSLIGGFCIGAGDSLEIKGCVFDGKITGGPNQSGCFTAWGTEGLRITDCMADPRDGTDFTGGTFCYEGGGAPTLTNCYYRKAFGGEQGNMAYSVKGAGGVTLDFGTPEANYSVSGVKAYGTGLEYGGVFYAAKDETVGLTPAWSGGATTFSADAGTLTQNDGAYTLTMPSQDVTITRTPVIEYPLWIGEAQVTGENLSGTGWSFDPETYTLTLTDFTYSGTGHGFIDNSDHKGTSAVVWTGERELTVEVHGNCSVSTPDSALVTAGIFSSADLKFTGDGTIDFTAGKVTSNVVVYAHSYGIYSNKLTVESGNITACAGKAPFSIGVEPTGGATINGGTLTAVGGEAGYNSIGIYVDDNAVLTVNAGTLNASGGEADSRSMGVAYGRSSEVILNGGEVVATGGKGNTGYGIFGWGVYSPLTVNDGAKLTASGSTGALVDLQTKNYVKGTGWSDVDGTEGRTEIDVNTEGADYNYKKVIFPGAKSYDLWVGSVEVTEYTLSGEGWSFDPEKFTLTLENYNYTGEGHNFSWSYMDCCSAITYLGSGNLTLDLKGTSSVTQQGRSLEVSAGVFIQGSLTIKGSGAITAAGGDAEYSIGIFASDGLVINVGEVTGETGAANGYNAYAIISNGDLIVNGGTVTGIAGEAPNGYSIGIYAHDYLKINGGTVTATGGSVYYASYGLYSEFENIIIKELSADAPTRVIASGETNAVRTSYYDDPKVQNHVEGIGWSDKNGTADETKIGVNTEGTTYSYKKVDFGHVYKDIVFKPTCTEKGYTKHECERCGKFTTSDETDSLGHDLGEWKTMKEPTCLDKGMKIKECSRCGYNEQELIDALGHDFTAEVVDEKYLISPATCTEPAAYVKSCTRCSMMCSDKFTVGKPLGHDLGEWETVAEPTCLDKGMKRCECSRCDYFEEEPVDALGHDFTAETVDEKYLASAAVCEAPAEYYKSCSRCGLAGTDTFATGDPLGHDLGEWETVTEPTCTDPGTKIKRCSRCRYSEDGVIDALGHDFTSEVADEKYLVSEADCTNAAVYYKSCTRCGEKVNETFTYGEPLGHAYMHVLTNPTCTEQGYTTHTCTRCGDEYVDGYKDALGHDMGDWETVTEPTCTDAGTKIKRCSRCTYTEDGVIPALEHDYEYKVAEATCEADGYTRYTCTRCGDTYDDNLEPALGHDMGEWETAKEPTCTEKGTKKRDCSRCDYFEEGVIDALGHDFAEEFTEDVIPTEETPGSMSRHCSRCDAVTDVTEIPPILLGDVNGDGKVNMKDMLYLRKVLAGTAQLDPRFFRNADVDKDGDITMKDVLQLRRMIAGA